VNGKTKFLSKDLVVIEIVPKAGQKVWHLGYQKKERESGGRDGGIWPEIIPKEKIRK
jgi:hypothetical protein